MKINKLNNLPLESGHLYEHSLVFTINNQYYFSAKILTDDNFKTPFTENELYLFMKNKYGQIQSTTSVDDAKYVNANGFFIQAITDGYRYTEVIGIGCYNSVNSFIAIENRYVVTNTLTNSFTLGNTCHLKKDTVTQIA